MLAASVISNSPVPTCAYEIQATSHPQSGRL